MKAIVESLDIRPDDRVLEIGCGQIRAFFDEPG